MVTKRINNRITALLAGFLVLFPLGGGQSACPPSFAVSDKPAETIPISQQAPETDPVLTALEKAARWLAGFPESELRFDAAIGLHFIGELLPGGLFDQARLKAMDNAQLDDDNPMQRIWNEYYEAAPAATRKWTALQPGERRVNVNRPVVEALYCDRNGLREESLAYIVGPMRDSGGYHTTHALWALTIAHEHGCLSDDRYDRLSKPLRDELLLAQPDKPIFRKTLDLDLYAERAVMLMLAKEVKWSKKWIQQILQHQNEDGSWGIVSEGEPPYYRYHATMICSWALALQRAL